jgi:hypothetical protein
VSGVPQFVTFGAGHLKLWNVTDGSADGTAASGCSGGGGSSSSGSSSSSGGGGGGGGGSGNGGGGTDIGRPDVSEGGRGLSTVCKLRLVEGSRPQYNGHPIPAVVQVGAPPSGVWCLVSGVCRLPSAVCCLLSAVCCLLSAVRCLLSAVCCPVSDACCLVSGVVQDVAFSLTRVWRLEQDVVFSRSHLLSVGGNGVVYVWEQVRGAPHPPTHPPA